MLNNIQHGIMYLVLAEKNKARRKIGELQTFLLHSPTYLSEISTFIKARKTFMGCQGVVGSVPQPFLISKLIRTKNKGK